MGRRADRDDGLRRQEHQASHDVRQQPIPQLVADTRRQIIERTPMKRLHPFALMLTLAGAMAACAPKPPAAMPAPAPGLFPGTAASRTSGGTSTKTEVPPPPPMIPVDNP